MAALALVLASCGGPKDSPPSCIAEGETLLGGTGLSCCEGLQLAACKTEGPPAEDGTATCGMPLMDCAICVRHCGDGQCTAGENRCNCLTDCAGGDRDAAAGCHENNVPFVAPPELQELGPAFPPAAPQQYCCGYNTSLEWVRSGVDCNATPLVEAVCLHRCRDLTCDPEEIPCTCPWDCATATEGCFSEGLEFSVLLHKAGCCPGLEPVICAIVTPATGQCYGGMPDCRICARQCGDGQCTAGENRCNCPADCS